MAFLATTTATEQAFDKIRRLATNSRSYLETQRAFLTQATTPADRVISIIQHLVVVLPRLDALSSTPGLAQYARDQLDDQSYDIVAEYQAMVAALEALRDELATTFPRSTPGDYLAYQTMDEDGVISHRTFTSGQLVDAVQAIDAVLATIV